MHFSLKQKSLQIRLNSNQQTNTTPSGLETERNYRNLSTQLDILNLKKKDYKELDLNGSFLIKWIVSN
jgi:hypothetical protein